MNSQMEKFKARIESIPAFIPVLLSCLSLYGAIILYSAAGGEMAPWAYKQMLTFGIFLPISFIIAITDLRLIYKFSYFFYCMTLVLLIIVEFAGRSAMGATRWLDLKIISIQPSELVKIAIVLALARFFHNRSRYVKSDIILLIPLLMALIPIALVIKQPDLGTGMITLMVAAIMFFLAGVRLIYFIISISAALIMMPVIWLSLHNYQKNRILTFLNPEQDPLGSGYNIIQSKIAIGSGGLVGKGLLNGSQGQLSFLPEYQTDFIFAFLAEELGFIGGIILLALYSIIIIYSLLIAVSCKSTFARMMASGITALFFLHIFINIAMVMGLVPVVGVPLPLISYGRTMMVSIMIGFSLVMNASVNKYVSV